MHLAYTIMEKSQRKHPFKDETAGRAWFDGFRRRHPNLTIQLDHSSTSAVVLYMAFYFKAYVCV